MTAPTAKAPPPEAVLIRRARESLAISPENAAPVTGVIKASQWRNIESGKSHAKDAVLARMAHVVKVTPDELIAANRGEAAEILRVILAREATPIESVQESDSLVEGLRKAEAMMAQGRRLMAEAESLLAELRKDENREGRRDIG